MANNLVQSAIRGKHLTAIAATLDDATVRLWQKL
jgi:hypothetical protein